MMKAHTSPLTGRLRRPKSAFRSALRVLAVLALALAPSPMGAQAPSSPAVPDFFTEWRWVDFGPDTGFPGGTVREMVEIGDTTWARTDRQILWWAGFEWNRWEPEGGVPQGMPTSLAADGRGGIIAVVGGEILRGGTRSSSALYREELESRGWKVRRAVPQGDGFLVTLASERSAVYRLTPEEIRDVTPLGGIAGSDHLWVMRDESVWVGGELGLGLWEDEGWTTVTRGNQANHRVSALWGGASGGVYAFLTAPPSDIGLWHWAEQGEVRRVESEGRNAALSGTVAPDSVVYAVYETGDVRVLEPGGSWRSLELPPSRSHGLHLIFATTEGDFWLGSARGLHLFRTSLLRWSSVRRPFPDPRNRIGAILQDRDGVTWLGTGDGIMRHPPDRGGEWIEEALGTPLGVVTGLAQDTTGAVWASSGSSFSGAFVFRNDQWRRFGVADGLYAGFIHDVKVARDGSLWFLSLREGEPETTPGAYRYKGGSVERWEDERGWLAGPVYDFAEGRDGSYWFGTSMGLCRFSAGEWSYWGEEEGVGPTGFTRVFTLLPEPTGEVWFGYGPAAGGGLGILHLDGSVSHLTPEDGLPGSSVNQIRRDPEGVIWISTDAGVGRFGGGEWAVLDGSTGLNPVRTWPIHFDGNTVIFGSVGGGVNILSRSEAENPPPRVRILEPISVAGTVARVRWRATAFKGELAPARVLTRSRFDGGEWSPWSADREIWTGESADLSWGPHTVDVQAKGLHGQLSDPARASFVISYPLFLRPVFFLPVGGLAVALAMVLLAARRRRIESALVLQASEQRLKTLVDSAPEAIAIYDVDADRFVDANQKALDMVGVSPDEVGTSHLSEFFSETQPDGPFSRKEAASLIRAALDGGEVTREWNVLRKDGVEIPTEVRIVRFPAEGRRLLRFSILDISERREAELQRAELEEQLRQAQKLEAVGQLTGGVAHDFNNLLTVIMGNLELLRDTPGFDPEMRGLIKGALEAASRSALLTQRLLAFSRRQTLRLGPVRIPEMVEGLTDLLTRSLGETIRIHTSFDADLWPVLADEGQLEHSLINLAVNARDAMPGGGELYIRANNELLGPEMAEPLEAKPGAYVALSVTDTGVGMDSEVLSKAFDPFFTTKEVGKGSGLGLSMVYGFARQVGGFVRIDSTVGEGTTVQLFLPKA